MDIDAVVFQQTLGRIGIIVGDIQLRRRNPDSAVTHVDDVQHQVTAKFALQTNAPGEYSPRAGTLIYIDEGRIRGQKTSGPDGKDRRVKVWINQRFQASSIARSKRI